MPDQRELDLGGIAHLRPFAELDLGREPGECVAPQARAVGLALEEQRHRRQVLTACGSTVSSVEGGRHQRLGVGLARRLEDRVGRARLDHLAVLHHQHLVGQRAHHAQVVADEQVGEAVALLQVAQQVDDLRLHRHVERRGRLVEHDEARLQHHGAGDGDALALAAGEFVRVAVPALGVEADLLQRVDDERSRSAPLPPSPCTFEALGDDLRRPTGAARASRTGPGTRSASRGAAAAARASRALDAPAEKDDRPLALDEAQERQAERGLARAALADHADRLAGLARATLTPSTALTWSTVRRSSPP